MRFIRENLFLLILVGSLVLLGGALLAIDWSVSDDVHRGIDDRVAISNSLQKLASGTKVNHKVVTKQRERVEAVKTAMARIRKEQTALNRGDPDPNKANHYYGVLELLKEPPGQPKVLVPAFPYNAKEYTDYGLALKFIDAHRIEIGKVFNLLNATRPPTEKEITNEARKLEGAIRLRISRTIREPNAPAPNAAAEAHKLAANELARDLAGKGSLYASDAIFQALTFPASETNPTEPALWESQFKLWAARDIVSAINGANAEAFEKLPPDQRNVMNAAVKRLVNFTVDSSYYLGGPGTTETHAPAGAAGTAPPPPPAGEAGHGGGNLTGRGCTHQYDVIHYDVAVVMPTRVLPLLIHAIEQNRHHTVLQVDWTEPQDSNTASGEEGLYYYGTEPVVEATLQCEMLLFTDWERDLMPVDFLRELPAAALRPEDIARLGGGRPPKKEH